MMIPNLEIISALYKAFYDVDAYPILLDKNLLNCADDYLYVIDNLSATYKTIVLLDVSEKITS